MSSLSRQQVVSWLSDVSIENKNVLDVGSGPEKYHARNWTTGNPSVYHTLDIQKKYNPTYRLDLNRDYDSSSTWIATPVTQHYQRMFCLETLEHLWNPLNALKLMSEWIKKGGIFYFSTPFINPIHDLTDYLRYTDEWWYTVLKECGFEDIQITARVATDGNPHLQMFYKTEGLRMSKVRLKKGESYKLKHIGYVGKATKK